MANAYIQTGSLDLIFNLICASFILHGCLVGALIRYLLQARTKIDEQYKELTASHQALQEAHEETRIYASQVESLTATRERNQIAREIHDTVGHTMTALLVQLQAARALQDHDPGQAAETIVLCEQLARSALQEVRLSVRALHDEGAVQSNLIDALKSLLAEFSNMTGLKTSLNVHGNPSVITSSLQPTIYRIIQESLTNAKRHGHADTAEVAIHCTEQQIEIDIQDNGEGSAEVVPGFGLINMRERVLEHSGSIQFISERGLGFHVRLLFPLQVKTWSFGGEQT